MFLNPNRITNSMHSSIFLEIIFKISKVYKPSDCTPLCFNSIEFEGLFIFQDLHLKKAASSSSISGYNSIFVFPITFKLSFENSSCEGSISLTSNSFLEVSNLPLNLQLE